MHIESIPILHNRVPSIVPSLRSAAKLHAVAQDVHNLALALVTPLCSQYNCSHVGVLRAALFVRQESPLKELNEFSHDHQTFNPQSAPWFAPPSAAESAPR